MKSIGDDGWGISPTGTILLPGAAVTHVIERLRRTIASGDALLALDDLFASEHTKWLLRVPEVVAAAAPAFRGRAVASRHLEFSVTRIPIGYHTGGGGRLLDEWRIQTWPHWADLRDASGETLAKLRSDTPVELRIPLPIQSGPNADGVLREGAKLRVVGARGPFVLVVPVKLWPSAGVEHLKITLERIAPDRDAP